MKSKTPFLKRPGTLTFMSSIISILIGLAIGFIVLLVINAGGAGEALKTILLNFFTRASGPAKLKALGNTLCKSTPLLMCALSVCFCYKVGLFNIGAAGQYEAGAGAALFCALGLHLPWFVCILAALAAGALLGIISGALKAYRSVNEVISGIMLNWITLYIVNTVLNAPGIKDTASPYTLTLAKENPGALIPDLGLSSFFGNNRTVTIAIPLAILIAVAVWVIMNKTKLGYELRATGYNKEAAKYAGMKEKYNIILTLAIGGGLAGMGAAFMFLSGYMQWSVTQTSVPGMGFNGIAATFLGGLNPLGTIFSSFFIQNITDGGSMINRSLYPSQISDLISAIIIYSCGFAGFFTMVLRNAGSKKADKKGGKK